MSTVRVTLPSRELGGEDRSRPSHRSTESVYELTNLRPIRGAYEQTDLVGDLIAAFDAAEES